MSGVLDFARDHAALLIAVLAVAEAFLVSLALRRIELLKARLALAVTAAEDAAKAAAMAASGGIDPEVVIQLLRTGRQTSLESVYQLMEQQAAEEDAARQAAFEAALRAPTAPTPPTPAPSDQGRPAFASYSPPPPMPTDRPAFIAIDSPPPTEPPTGDDDDSMSKRLGRYG